MTDLPLSDSPYRPPSEKQPAQHADIPPAINSHSLLPFAQLGLRLLGVLLVADGLGAILGGFVQGVMQGRAYAAQGYGVVVDPHSAGWAAGGIPHLIIGVYLVVGGNWILQNVFLPSQRPNSDAHIDPMVESGEPDDAREPPS
ncbi:hypothetical protein FYK55_17090 [Roseiconus nitratireducens]|uniref:Uncharacterized protein n=1 Tax=Roseiconus nitratireducens TaxID=2605748 RepID=A0A5M6D355_9BACT|nr:hypothetical protein [Roseiconus nitratireducens]KAA5541911.1 hypothetical protein FYK55_17090 [Roseiconus nitratireducens]